MSKLNAREKVLLVVALAAVLGFLGWKFAFVPLQSEVTELRAEKDVLQTEVDRLEDIISRKAAFEKEWQEMEGEKELLSIALPAQNQLPQVLGNLEDLIGRYPVKLNLLRSEGFITEQAEYPGISFRAGFGGTDGNLLALFEELERFPHRLIASEAAWSREAGESSNLELAFALVFRTEDGEQEAGEEQKIEAEEKAVDEEGEQAEE